MEQNGNKLIIPYQLPTLNEIIEQSKRHWSKYSLYKKRWTHIVKTQVEKQEFTIDDLPVDFIFVWYCQNRRADPDNISAGQKYIFDGMILADVIPNDGWKQINSISHKFEVDKENPRVEVLAEKSG